MNSFCEKVKIIEEYSIILFKSFDFGTQKRAARATMPRFEIESEMSPSLELARKFEPDP